MAINPESQYPGKIAPSTADYPYGAARNITVPGDGTGTPWEAALVNDLFGFQQSLLSFAGITPSGTPEKVGASQYLQALRKIVGVSFDDLAALDAATVLSVGDIVEIRGRFAPGDGGDNMYEIVAAATGTDDGGSYIDLSGSGLQAKALFPGGYINLLHFGVDLTGVADSTTEAQNAINYVDDTAGLLSMLPGVCRTTATLNVTRPMSLIGVYPAAYEGAIGTRGNGSWFHFDHTGVGINIAGAAVMGTVFLDKFGTFRTQPTPAPAWTPTAHDFDIVFNNSDIIIGDLVLLNPTKGIKGRTGNAGRLRINTLRGQPLEVGLDLDQQYDAPNIGMIHFWPFWQDNTDVHTYTLQNLDALYFQRVDNPFIGQLFTIFARAGLRIGQSADGTTNKLRAGNVDFDRGNFGIWVDSTSVAGTRCQFANFSSQGETGLAGTKGIFVQGDNAVIQIANADIRECDQNGVRVEGTANWVRIGRLTVVNYDISAGGYPAVEALVGSFAEVQGRPEITGSGGGARFGGTGTIFVDEWRSFTPVVTATVGVFTTLGTVSGRYKRFGNTITFEVDIEIVTNGTAAGSIRATLPDNVITAIYQAVGREVNATGVSLVGTIGPGTNYVDIYRYDNAYPGADGHRIVVSGLHEIA